MSLPRDISPEARARRSLLADLLAGLALAAGVVVFAAGLGIVGVVGAVSLLLLGASFAVEWLIRRGRRPPARRRPEAGR